MRCGCSAPTAAREADLGEALTGAANGVVTAEAEGGVRARAALDPGDFRARYFIGLAAEQDGRPKEAAADLARAAGGRASGRALGRIRARVAGARRCARGRRQAAPSAESEAADIAAAGEISPEQRDDNGARHGRAARRAPEARRLRCRRMAAAACAPIWCWATRQGGAAPPPTRGARLPSEPDKLRRLEELVKGLGLEG